MLEWLKKKIKGEANEVSKEDKSQISIEQENLKVL